MTHVVLSNLICYRISLCSLPTPKFGRNYYMYPRKIMVLPNIITFHGGVIGEMFIFLIFRLKKAHVYESFVKANFYTTIEFRVKPSFNMWTYIYIFISMWLTHDQWVKRITNTRKFAAPCINVECVGSAHFSFPIRIIAIALALFSLFFIVSQRIIFFHYDGNNTSIRFYYRYLRRKYFGTSCVL